jgi:hypothetical protein
VRAIARSRRSSSSELEAALACTWIVVDTSNDIQLFMFGFRSSRLQALYRIDWLKFGCGSGASATDSRCASAGCASR